jgi:hypothetical protein
MNINDILNEIENLKKENEILKNSLTQTQEHLKKYTAPLNMKKYYDNNKEEIKKKVKEYREKTQYYSNLSSDKKKEYAKKAYLKKKEKMEKEKMEKEKNKDI